MDLWDSLGTRGDHIEIVPHRPAWAELFREERGEILAVCSGVVTVVEHIGSTAVPGLAAKPILDLMPGLEKIADGERLVAPMAVLGYRCRGENGIPGRLYFDKHRQGRCVAHVHMFEIGGEHWRRHLLFRDYLLRHPDTAREYERLKMRLAEAFRNDRTAYTEAKSAFIEAVVARASVNAAGPAG